MKDRTKNLLKGKLKTALLISAELVVMIGVSVLVFGSNYKGVSITSLPTVILSAVSLLCAVAVSVIAFLCGDRFASSFFAFIYGLCLVGLIVSLLTLGGETYGTWETLRFVFAFPFLQFTPLILNFSGYNTAVVFAVGAGISALLFGFNFFSALKRKKEGEG